MLKAIRAQVVYHWWRALLVIATTGLFALGGMTSASTYNFAGVAHLIVGGAVVGLIGLIFGLFLAYEMLAPIDPNERQVGAWTAAAQTLSH